MIMWQETWVAGLLLQPNNKSLAGRGARLSWTVAGSFSVDPAQAGWLDNRYLQSA